MRVDKFLKVSRIIKRRTVANDSCDTEHVEVNGKRAKADQGGHRTEENIQEGLFVFAVTGVEKAQAFCRKEPVENILFLFHKRAVQSEKQRVISSISIPRSRKECKGSQFLYCAE